MGVAVLGLVTGQVKKAPFPVKLGVRFDTVKKPSIPHSLPDELGGRLRVAWIVLQNDCLNLAA